MTSFSQCPRCGLYSVENFTTHSYCWECTYSPEYDYIFSRGQSFKCSEEVPNWPQKQMHPDLEDDLDDFLLDEATS